MTDQNWVLQFNNRHHDVCSDPAEVRNVGGLSAAGFFLAVAVSTAWAQPATDERAPAERVSVGRAAFDIGAALTVPTPLQATDPRSKAISCQVICSAFEPRQSLVQIAWPEQVGAAADTQALRLDIIGAPSKFNEGNYGTVRISSIPNIETQPGVGIDLEAVRKQPRPVLVQRVENNRIMARDPNLPDPESLKKERLPEARLQLSQAMKQALEQDMQSGAFGRMQVLAQSVELKRSIPHRNVILEGMAPGLTYKIRLVQERAGAVADSVAEDICRVPVCPADFVAPH